jgi:predicted hydrolase (HD superfamily)
MNRDKALEELNARLENKENIKYSLAVEAIMLEFAEFYDEDRGKWAMTGLLHNIDYEKVADNPSERGVVAEKILSNFKLDKFIIYAIKANNDLSGLERKRRLDKILHSSSLLVLLINEVIKEGPKKAFKELTVEDIINKINQRDFKPEIDRVQIMKAEELDVPFEKFIELSLRAVTKISDELEK